MKIPIEQWRPDLNIVENAKLRGIKIPSAYMYACRHGLSFKRKPHITGKEGRRLKPLWKRIEDEGLIKACR